MKNVTVENFRRLPDDKYKECESIPTWNYWTSHLKKSSAGRKKKEHALSYHLHGVHGPVCSTTGNHSRHFFGNTTGCSRTAGCGMRVRR